MSAGRIFLAGLMLAMVMVPVSMASVSGARAERPKAAGAEKPAAAAASKTYDRDYIGGMQTYVAKYEDTMVQIARDFNIGFVELRSANPFLDPWIPGEGKKIIIPTMNLLPNTVREGVVINLSEMRMYAYMKPGQKPQTFPIGIGREGLLTPSGTTTIQRKKEGPVWRPTARMRKEHPELPVEVLPGPDNPMGTHAMYLGWPEYAIHGTDKPFSIGRRVSSGCIRMYPEDISKAFKMFPVGTRITVVDQPVKVGWVGESLYLEVHPTTSQADRMELDGGLPGYVFTEDDLGLIVAAAGDHIRELNWPLIRQVVRERRGYPVEILKLDSKTDASPARTQKDTAADQIPDAAPGKQAVKGTPVIAEKAAVAAEAAIATTPN